MGAADSPDRKRRRHDSRERHSSRDDRGAERISRERSRERPRGRDEEGYVRPRQQGEYGKPASDARDRPAGTSGRSHHESSRREREREQEPLSGRGGGSSRQRDPEWDDRDRQQGRQAPHSSRERSRERPRDGEADRQRDRERERDRDRGAGHHPTGRDEGRRQDWGSSRGGREDAGQGGGRDGRHQQHHQRTDGPAQQQHEHRDGRGPQGAAGRQHQQQQRRGGDEPQGKPKWGKPEEWAADEPPPPGPPKEAPNMGLSGKLAAETNKTADGSAELKFQAPAEARVCKKPVWKLFVYKGSDMTGDPISLTQMPFYMFGKDRKVADIPTDHPSCSRQHAVIVFREVQVDAPDGIGYSRAVKPYLLDLETTNGTTINNERLEGARYYELLTGDVIRFGFSSRDYVVMNESAVQ